MDQDPNNPKKLFPIFCLANGKNSLNKPATTSENTFIHLNPLLSEERNQDKTLIKISVKKDKIPEESKSQNTSQKKSGTKFHYAYDYYQNKNVQNLLPNGQSGIQLSILALPKLH